MVSNINQIVYQLFQKETLEQVSENELRYFLSQYPYSGTGHLLLAKKLQLDGERRAFDREIAVTSVYFNNPAWLQFVLQPVVDQAAAQLNGYRAPEPDVADDTELKIDEYDIADGEINEERPQELYIAGDDEKSDQDIVISQPEIDEPGEVDFLMSTGHDEPINEDPQNENGNSEFSTEPPAQLPDENSVTIPIIEKTDDAVGFVQPGENPQAGHFEEAPQAGHIAEALQSEHFAETLQSGQPVENPVAAQPVETPVAGQPVETPVAGQPIEVLEIEQPAEDALFENVKPVRNEETFSDNGVPAVPEGPEAPEAPEAREVPILADGPVEQSIVRPVDAPVVGKLEFDPYHTIDYFASQGIKLKLEDYSRDKLGQQLKSFTEWIRSMKRLPQQPGEINMNDTDQHSIRRIAEHSVEDKEVLTESMAEVWAKQGNYEKARQVYRKLSLQNPAKSVYFAAKIEQLKVL